MKNYIIINRALAAKKRICMIIMAAALIALPAMAQEWQSTSTMQGTGSNYAPQVTAVGATEVSGMATTTTESYSPAKAPSGPRRAGEFSTATEYGQGPSPLGDALIPLMLCACAYLIVRVFLKRKRALNGE